MEKSRSGMEVRVRRGRCPDHGTVEATKEVPKIRFPFFLYGTLRLLSSFRPYSCPDCGAKVS